MNYQAWSNECDKQFADDVKRWKQQRDDIKNKHLKKIEEYRKKHGDYWIYKDVYIPLEINNIPALDNANDVSFYFNGLEISVGETQVFSECEPYTIDEYHDKFCRFDDNTNRWIYIAEK